SPGTSRRHDGARSRGAGRCRRSRRRDRSRGVLSWIGRRERGPALHHGLVEVSCTCRLPTVTAAYSVTMPSSPPSVRPVLAALLTVLLLTASALVSGPATLVPAARAENPAPAPQAPSAPPDGDADTPVSMDLVSLTPT